MDYPYPALVSQLQFLCTPAEYAKILGSRIRRWGALPLAEWDYWKILPTYTYAYCPLCQRQYQEQADTYSLRMWGGACYLWDALCGLAEDHPAPLKRCVHWIGVAHFTNLHGKMPTELDWFQQETGEIPVVTPWLLPDDIESYVILHALPLCRMERNQFVPSYTVFVLTYFSQYPGLVLKRIYSEPSDDPEYRPALLAPSNYTFPDFNEWAQRGKLGWLDLTKPDFPLSIGQDAILPDFYRGIQGSTERFYWTSRKSRLLSKLTRIFWRFVDSLTPMPE